MKFRPTLRVRLTAVYALLFLAGGGLLLAASYALVSRNLTSTPERVESLAAEQVDPFGSSPAEREAEQRFERAVRDQVADDALADLRTQYGLALLGLAGLCVGLGWLASGRALRPLGLIGATADRISSDRLGERIRLPGPEDELKELADTIDSMLARLDAAFERQRRFITSASHELRTPLTVMRAEIEVALANPNADEAELRAAAENVRVALDRSEQLIGSLMTLARSEALRELRDVDLVAAVRNALAHLREEIADAGLGVSTALGPATVQGDRRLLERLAANLVENAVRHNDRDGFVSIESATSEGEATLVVENSGPAVAPDAVSTLVEPFKRLDARRGRARGMGLGLSIADAVARAHGGVLSLEARRGGGLRAVVRLPVHAVRPFVGGGDDRGAEEATAGVASSKRDRLAVRT